MELKEVIGLRRSIRYYKSWRPVEKEKIEKILEAARRASHAANCNVSGCVVVENREDNEAATKVRDTVIQFSQVHVQQAPIWLMWFLDLARWDKQAETLKQLIDAKALNATHGWSHNYVDKFVVPMTKAAMQQDEGFAASMFDLGQAVAQATLVAYEEGLGTCLNACGNVREALGLPESCRVVYLQTLGYPAESRDAGGQRPRAAFEELFFWNTHDSPITPSSEVEAELKAAKMVSDPAPLPWREKEIKALAHMFGLPE